MLTGACVSQDVEAIASKIYIGGVVLVMLYFDFTFYVYVENAEDEQPLLDTNFPDVCFQKEGLQLHTYRQGVAGCPELRRLSLWKVQNDLDDLEEAGGAAVAALAQGKLSLAASLHADEKQNESRREEDVKFGDAKANKLLSSSIDGPRKASLPHHIAPLKPSNGVMTLKKMPNLGLTAPWDDTGKPLGLRK